MKGKGEEEIKDEPTAMSALVIFVAPFFKESVVEFLDALAGLEHVHLAVVSQDSWELFPEEIRRVASFRQVSDATSSDHLAGAAYDLSRRLGTRPHRILAINEQIQVQVAEVRERLDIPGMSSETIRKFRDKGVMKECFRAAGVPCARHKAAQSVEEARAFVKSVGFPVCVKPVDGAAAQATFKVDSLEVLEQILRASAPNPERPIQIEEFVVGEESSFETFSLNGEHLWHSLTHYYPTPLDVMNNPWIQWQVISPKEIDDPRYDDIKEAGRRALDALGMETGLTHLEWFRREDGTIAISEVAARPPGAQIVTMINRAHDIDSCRIWCEVMVYGHCPPIPERKYAVGAAFLRGLGGGRVQAVHGLEVLEELGDMVVDVGLPKPGDPAANTYEGEGFILVRHPETQKVKDAVALIVDRVRVELI